MQKLSPGNLTALLQSKKSAAVKLRLPKFETRYEDSLKDELTSLGMGVAFEPDRADFSLMQTSRARNLYISEVQHKTFCRVDELGTEAAAVTSVEVSLTSMPVEWAIAAATGNTLATTRGCSAGYSFWGTNSVMDFNPKPSDQIPASSYTGFKGVIVLTGHYGAAQQIVVRDVAVRASRCLGIPILGTPEYILALDAGYLGDHAAWGETSLMMYLDPDSVAIDRLGEPPHKGVGGRDPREATVADGRRLAETIIGRLAEVGAAMSKWDAATLAKFQDAEAAIVSRQMTLAAETKQVWAGWRNIGKGALSSYGKLLAQGKFEEIAELAKGL